MTIHEVELHKDNDFIDSDVVSKLLGITTNNLRQLVYRKRLVPTGRHKRKSLFLIADVLALKTHRSDSSGNASAL